MSAGNGLQNTAGEPVSDVQSVLDAILGNQQTTLGMLDALVPRPQSLNVSSASVPVPAPDCTQFERTRHRLNTVLVQAREIDERINWLGMQFGAQPRVRDDIPF